MEKTKLRPRKTKYGWRVYAQLAGAFRWRQFSDRKYQSASACERDIKNVVNAFKDQFQEG